MSLKTRQFLSTVTKRLWLRKTSHSTLLIQRLGMHGRRVLNGSSQSSVPRPTCPRRKSVDGDDRRRRQFDGGCRRDMLARCCEGSGPPKRIAEIGSWIQDPQPVELMEQRGYAIRFPRQKTPLEQCIQDWLKKPRQKLFRHAGDSYSQS